MNIQSFFMYLAVMAGVTYLIRALPYVLVRKEVKNVFLKSFLTYIPYTVLAAMTFPAILGATQSAYSALAGCIVALALAYFERGLVQVALGASAAVFLTELVMKYICG